MRHDEDTIYKYRARNAIRRIFIMMFSTTILYVLLSVLLIIIAMLSQWMILAHASLALIQAAVGNMVLFLPCGLLEVKYG